MGNISGDIVASLQKGDVSMNQLKDLSSLACDRTFADNFIINKGFHELVKLVCKEKGGRLVIQSTWFICYPSAQYCIVFSFMMSELLIKLPGSRGCNMASYCC